MDNEKLKAIIGRMSRRLATMEAQHVKILAEYEAFRKACEAAQAPRSITEEIDQIPGRRNFYNLTGQVVFDISQNNQLGPPVMFQVSQDGPFIMTHYPMVIWKPSAPATATQFGFWRPVATWPLPDQVVDGDRIDLSYNFLDGGSQRNFQNEIVPPIFSRPDNMAPLPVPTLFQPNASIQFQPFYDRILFDPTVAIPTTSGTLKVALPGYRISNL